MQRNCESPASFSKTNTKRPANTSRKGPCGKLMLTFTHETLWPHQSQALKLNRGTHSNRHLGTELTAGWVTKLPEKRTSNTLPPSSYPNGTCFTF